MLQLYSLNFAIFILMKSLLIFSKHHDFILKIDLDCIFLY